MRVQAAQPAVANADGIVTIHFVYDPVANPLPTVLARINGRSTPGVFVLDTGCAGLVLNTGTSTASATPGADPAVTGAIGLQILADGAQTGSPPALTIHCPTTEMSIGALGELPLPDNANGSGVAGLLGMNLFRGYRMKFDFAADVLTLIPNRLAIPADAAVHAPDTTILPMRQRVGDPCPQVSVTGGDVGGAAVQAVIDTSCADSLIPSADAANLKPQTPAPTVLVRHVGTSAGAVDAHFIMLPVLRIGDLSEPDVELCVTESSVGDVPVSRSGSTVDPSRIGLNVLSRFVITVDSERRQVYLQRVPEYSKRVWRAALPEAGLIRDGDGLIVHLIVAGLSAATAGLLLDDKVTAVDGYRFDVHRDNLAYLMTRMDGVVGTTTLVEVDRSSRHLTLSIARDNLFVLLQVGRATAGESGFGLTPIGDGRFVFAKIKPGGAIETAGIKDGEILVAVDGVPVAGKSIVDILALLSKQRGTQVHMSVQSRDSLTPPRDVTVTLEKRPE